MKLKEAADKYRIPIKALAKMYRMGLLSLELTSEQLSHIEFISNIWGKNEFIRWQMSKKPKKQREKIIREAGMNKIEQYLYNRYFNAIKKGDKLYKAQLANEVKTYLGVPITDKLFNTIEQMRKKAYYDKTKAQNQSDAKSYED
jgi:hypothetical protein